MPSISLNNSGMSDTTISKFTRVLPLSIRKEAGGIFPNSLGLGDSSGGHHQGEQKENVRVTLTYPSPACGAMNPHKEIALRLTNDENPLFFYHLRITEAEFPELKTQQGLLVDFYGFPNQLVTLLEKCDLNYGGDDSSGPKFVLVMKIGGNNTVLDIVESNPFKYLCHLSLQINSGSDGEVKKYLCDVTTGLKKDYQLLSDKYNHLISAMENENARTKDQMEQKNMEINQLRDQLHSQANSLSTKHFRDMTEEKEKLLKLQSELAAKFEHERNDLERRQSQAVSTLEDRVSSLELENRELIQNKYKSETTMQETANKVKHYEDDLKLLQQELTLMRKQNEKLDHDYHEKHRVTGNLHNRVTTLETDLREKQALIQRYHEQITQISEQKRTLEDHAAGMVKEVERVKEVNKRISAELMKANEIIKKLQDDIRTLNSKTKLQAQVTTEQERVIVDRDKNIKQLESELSTLKDSLTATESDVKRLTATLEESEVKIDELEKARKSNENMISWLNKQLNEFQGLSNLSKFRQNLAFSANHIPTDPSSKSPPNNNLPNSAGFGIQSGAPPFEITGVGSGIGNSGRRFGGAYSGNQSQNTMPNGTPSWMHIYQSTSTPLEDDLSSRLEKVAATTGMHNMNYNDLKSRFTDRFATDNNQDQDQEKAQDKKENQESPTEPKPKTASRPPTWARGRGGRVTIETGAHSKASGGILRR